MYAVYKITNLINNKSYIGSSIRVYKRWQEHINTAFNPNNPHYNYPLYQAIRKYELKNFNFSILKDDFNSIEEMQNFQYKMILFYHSLTHENGYNQTLQTHCAFADPIIKQSMINKISTPCAKIDQNNNILEIYTSYHDAARKNNIIGYESAIRKVCKGIQSSVNGILFRDLDEQNNIIIKPIKTYHNKKPLIAINLNNPDEQILFQSISQAAKQLNLTDRRQIQEHLKGNTRYSVVKGYLIREIDTEGNIISNGIDIDVAIQKYNNEHPLINGERKNIKEWCSFFNISTNSYYKRRKNGMGVIEALTTPKRR